MLTSAIPVVSEKTVSHSSFPPPYGLIQLKAGMARRKQPLSVTTGATSSRNIPNQHYNSPSAEELFRELVVGDNSYPSDSTSTILPPITTPSQVMADRFPSLEDFSPSECLLSTSMPPNL